MDFAPAFRHNVTMFDWHFLAGAVAAAPLWILLTVWLSRRVLRLARRLSTRARGQEQWAELGHLGAGLAHEIKNPLSTINLNLKLMSEDLQGSPRQEHRRLLSRLAGVRQEADRLKDILEDFLRYAGKYELQVAVVDLRRVIRELADFFDPQAQAGRVLLRVALGEQPVPCPVDEDLLKQALLNLMINSVQAMAGGGELLVRLSSHRQEAMIEVIDTGPGIAPEEIEKVFQVYYSTKKGGTGLGLPTTRRIIKEHGGNIAVQSQVGKGTRFLVTLPLADR